ncbi:MAG TPA: hypothetical protein VIM79_19475 [Niastella sp.]
MPVRKKKKAHANRLKVEKAQHLKQFVHDVKCIIERSSGAEVLRYIPEYEFEVIYKFLFRPVNIRAASGEDISDDVLRLSNCMLSHLFKYTIIKLNIGEIDQLSLYHYYSLGYTIMAYITWLADDAYPHAMEVKKALAPWGTLIESAADEEAMDKFYGIMFMIAVFFSDLTDHLYTLEYNPNFLQRGFMNLGVYSEMYKRPVSQIKVRIEEHMRPAWQLGWGFPGQDRQLSYMSIKSEDVFLAPGNMLDVYIQSHALNRLAERLDGVETGVLHFNIYNSLSELKVCKSRKGFLMFDYAIFGKKAGYFLGEVVDGKIVLKTFLFLTNTGTPEAEKLKAATGLMKEDIMYLAIDKLSTFVYSDIAGNDRIKQLFIDAGCESLFKIDKGHFAGRGDDAITAKAEMIAKYLQVDALPDYRGFSK